MNPIDTLTNDDLDRLDARALAALSYADGCPEGDPGADVIDDVARDVLALIAEVRRLRGVAEPVATSALPPIGSRWGDLSPEQRAALPVGTVMVWAAVGVVVRRTAHLSGGWVSVSHEDRGPYEADELCDDNAILSYPEGSR